MTALATYEQSVSPETVAEVPLTGLSFELPVFQCEDCIVKKTIFGPDTEPFEVAYTFCVDSAGRCFDPTEGLGDGNDDPDFDDDSEPDPSLN
jgi:hypothetical protein